MKQAGGRGRGASDNEAEKWRREVGSQGPNKEADVNDESPLPVAQPSC